MSAARDSSTPTQKPAARAVPVDQVRKRDIEQFRHSTLASACIASAALVLSALMSTQSPVVPFDLPIRCFSEISNVRCQGITKIQQIGTLSPYCVCLNNARSMLILAGSFIPVALLIVILPFLLLSTYKIPRATLLLLGIELITQLGVHGWNLGYVLDRPTFNNFKSTDTALGKLSPAPD